jgi:hypothetical protein
MLFLGVALGVGFGKGLTSLLQVVAGDDKSTSLVGFAFGLLSFIVALAYLPLWLDPGEYVQPRSGRIDGKIQTAELRFAMVFALVGGVTTYAISNSRPVSFGVALGLALVGACVGVDFKRRVHRLRTRPQEDALPELVP